MLSKFGPSLFVDHKVVVEVDIGFRDTPAQEQRSY